MTGEITKIAFRRFFLKAALGALKNGFASESIVKDSVERMLLALAPARTRKCHLRPNLAAVEASNAVLTPPRLSDCT